jgi:hypothetical protein
LLHKQRFGRQLPIGGQFYYLAEVNIVVQYESGYFIGGVTADITRLVLNLMYRAVLRLLMVPEMVSPVLPNTFPGAKYSWAVAGRTNGKKGKDRNGKKGS